MAMAMFCESDVVSFFFCFFIYVVEKRFPCILCISGIDCAVQAQKRENNIQRDITKERERLRMR